MVIDKKSDSSVRPLTRSELELVVDYFHSADHAFLRGMGVDPARLPARAEWLNRLWRDFDSPDDKKETFYLGWLKDGDLVGHSNINKIRFGEEAFIHLHLWKPELRRGGMGTAFFKLSTSIFRERFALKRILCEPYAQNAAPNRVLTKLGFRLVKTYRTVPGLINFEQEVNHYELDHAIT
jgi:RimJ/RimL family protein N-acetyltransferase